MTRLTDSIECVNDDSLPEFWNPQAKTRGRNYGSVFRADYTGVVLRNSAFRTSLANIPTCYWPDSHTITAQCCLEAIIEYRASPLPLFNVYTVSGHKLVSTCISSSHTSRALNLQNFCRSRRVFEVRTNAEGSHDYNVRIMVSFESDWYHIRILIHKSSN